MEMIRCTCNNNCTNGCHGTCDENCWQGCYQACTVGCANSCTGDCDGCSSCTGGCTSCTGTCEGCSSSCSSACKGSCKGDCNNGCTSASASTTIANLGASIAAGQTIVPADLKSVKTAIENELKRRNKTASINSYKTAITAANALLLEHPDKIFLDIKAVANVSYARTTTVAKASDFTTAIQYIKTLMAQNIK